MISKAETKEEAYTELAVDRFLKSFLQDLKRLEKNISSGSCQCKEPIKCRNCDEMVIMTVTGEVCPSCYC